MPTTIQKIESLPIDLDVVASIKDRLLLINDQPLTVDETTLLVGESVEDEDITVEEGVVKPDEEVVVDVLFATQPKVVEEEEETPSNLFETAKHVISCSEKFTGVSMEVNILKEKEVLNSGRQRCFILTLHDYGFDSKHFLLL